MKMLKKLSGGIAPFLFGVLFAVAGVSIGLKHIAERTALEQQKKELGLRLFS